MVNNIDIVNTAVTLIIKAAILTARFSGRVRKRSLKRLSKMDADSKDKEIIFLSASTVRNILNRPQPPKQPVSQPLPKKAEDEKARSIPAWYPNHV